MTYTLAANPRTITKASIRRASAAARREMVRLERRAIAELELVYKQARDDITAAISAYAGRDGSLRLESLQHILTGVDAKIDALGKARNHLLDNSMLVAAQHGVAPFAMAWSAELSTVADDVVRWAYNFKANDGLQLSERLWAIDRGAKEAVGQAIQSVVIQGHSASRAAADLLAKGKRVPPDIAAQATMANATGVAKSAGEALLTGEGNAHANAMRLMRTEINRAHGEAYMAGGEDHPERGGWRFMLSPNHPQPDICDMHASANLYGLGPGVYPSRTRCPWPAHPGTLSFVEFVFKEEITEEDKAGRVDRTGWIDGQPQHMQAAVLGSKQKAAAFRAGVLKENQITTPWRVLKERYIKQGIDIDAFKAVRQVVGTIKGTQVFGMPLAEFTAYSSAAMRNAPAVARMVMKQVIPPASIRIIPKGTSYFQGNGLVLAKSSMKARPGFQSPYNVYRHEYGHYIDFWALSDGSKVGKVISSTTAKRGGMLEAFNQAKKHLSSRSAVGMSLRGRINNDLLEMNDTVLADLFGSLTKNKIGWGHSNSYLSRPGFAETEVFANLWETYSRTDRRAWEYLSNELPDLTNRFITILEEVAR